MAHSRMKLKTGDKVVVLTGKDRKQTGKIVAINYEKGRVQIEGLHAGIKHVKPTQANQGGSLEKINRFVDISNVSIIHPTKKAQGSRIGYESNGKNGKKRVYKQAENKEIK